VKSYKKLKNKKEKMKTKMKTKAKKLSENAVGTPFAYPISSTLELNTFHPYSLHIYGFKPCFAFIYHTFSPTSLQAIK